MQLFDGASQSLTTDTGLYETPFDGLVTPDGATLLLDPIGIGTDTPQSLLTLYGISRGAAMHGILIYDPAVVVPDITAVLYSLLDLTTPVTTLADSFSRTWQSWISEPGSGEIHLMNDDTDLALFSGDGNDIVNLAYKGRLSFSMIAETYEQTTVAQDEEAAESTVWSGRGHLALLERMLVYPTGGVGRSPVEEDRYFNWTSASFDDSGWGPAFVVCSVGAAKTFWGTVISVWDADFPDDGAAILGSTGGTPANDPQSISGGDLYFRQTITIAAEGDYKFFIGIDNYGELFCDGQLLTTVGSDQANQGQGWQQMNQVTVHLTAGTHLVAMHVVNLPQAVENPAGGAWTLYVLDENGLAGEIKAHSDATAVSVEYPATAPGMTPGQVMILCLQEGQARGVLSSLTWTFDADVDSDGVAWPVTAEISTKVGTDVLTFFRELAGTYIDMAMLPGTLELSAWNFGGRGGASGVTLLSPSDPTDPTTGNLTGLIHRGET